MNYLGHLILSGSDEKILLGNFLGDHVSNKMLYLYDASILKGIKLHREIDLFTDSHPISRDLRAMLFDQYRHRSRVILDLFYDHFLAANFLDYQSVSLPDYVIKVSDILQKQLHLMPKSAKHYFMAMRKYGWLEGYASIDVIRLVLNQMSKRKDMDPMGPSVKVLEKHYLHFKVQTHAFLHEAIAHFLEDKIRV
jgi:acyl carrier protein phosphodiesterase